MENDLSTAQIQEVIHSLLASVKITAAPCHIHRQVAICKCSTALSTFTPELAMKLKKSWFLYMFENHIYGTHEAFAYDGSQESHHAYVAYHGRTPKHFAREFLLGDAIAQCIGPNGRLQDTIKAMIDYWTMRTKQWKGKYGDRATTSKLWPCEEYGDLHLEHLQGTVVPKHFITEECKSKMITGGKVPTEVFEVGPSWHNNKVDLMLIECTEVSKFDPTKIRLQVKDDSVKAMTMVEWMLERYRLAPTPGAREWWLRIGILKIEPCHEDCDRSVEIIAQGMPGFVTDLFDRFGASAADYKVTVWWTTCPRTGHKVIQMLGGGEMVAEGQFMALIREASKEETNQAGEQGILNKFIEQDLNGTVKVIRTPEV